MNFEQALSFVESTLKFGSVLKLNNIRILLDLLGNPHQQPQLKFVHVAGTNGKGSVSVYVAEILAQNGYKTALYISPYVDCLNEKIQINRTNISNDQFAEYVSRVKEKIDIMLLRGEAHPTEFEIITAVAFLYFAEQQCDFAVIEVGLGGEFDATNVIPSPLISIITSISYDHMRQLGNTLKQIALAKCGIIKPNCHVISYAPQSTEVLKVIKETCLSRNVGLNVVDDEAIFIKNMHSHQTRFDYKNMTDLKINMIGEHQVFNAVTAVEAVMALSNRFGIEISINSVYQGLCNAKLKGRFDIINRCPLVLIDGCHNYLGVLSFVEAMDYYFGDKNKIIIMGMMSDKECEKCIAEVAKIAAVFLPVSSDSSRALPANVVARYAEMFNDHVHVLKNRNAALEWAYKRTGADDVICLCGSFYVIGNCELRNEFCGQ